MRAQVGLEIAFELRQAGLARERFARAEEGQDDVGLLLLQVLRRIPEVERARLQRERVPLHPRFRTRSCRSGNRSISSVSK